MRSASLLQAVEDLEGAEAERREHDAHDQRENRQPDQNECRIAAKKPFHLSALLASARAAIKDPRASTRIAAELVPRDAKVKQKSMSASESLIVGRAAGGAAGAICRLVQGARLAPARPSARAARARRCGPRHAPHCADRRRQDAGGLSAEPGRSCRAARRSESRRRPSTPFMSRRSRRWPWTSRGTWRLPVAEMGLPIRLETRTGDTPASRRARQRILPPDILLTTPEQIALMLSHKGAPELFGAAQICHPR